MSDYKRTITGTVISDKMQKTLVVEVRRLKKHPLYKKVVRRTTKYHVHDGLSIAKKGDIVSIVECRPVSKTVNWTLHSLISKSKAV